MKSKDKWMKEQVEIAKRVIRGEIYNDVLGAENGTDLEVMILSANNHSESILEW